MLERQEEHKRRGQQEGRKKVPRLAEAPKQERQEGEQRSREKAAEAQIRPYESSSQSEREMYRRRENEAQTLKKSGLHYDSSLFFCFYLSL